MCLIRLFIEEENDKHDEKETEVKEEAPEKTDEKMEEEIPEEAAQPEENTTKLCMFFFHVLSR